MSLVHVGTLFTLLINKLVQFREFVRAKLRKKVFSCMRPII